MRRRKHIFAIATGLLILLCIPAYARAEGETPMEIQEGVKQVLDSSDMSALESIYFGLPHEVRALWGDKTLYSMVEEYATGEGGYLGVTLQNGILSLIKSMLPSVLPLLISLIAIAIITGFLRAMSDAGISGLHDIGGFVCQCFAIGIAFTGFMQLALLARDSILETAQFIEAAFPVLLTLLTAAGGIASSGIFQPAMAMLCSGISVALQDIVMPMILIGGVMGVLNNITGRVQLGQLFTLSKTVAKWLIGLLFTLYFAVTSLQGMTAAAFDGVSVRTAKFAIDKLVPIVGGAVSGTIDTMLGCALLAKNAVGLVAILICCGTVCMPLLRIATGIFSFRLAAGLCEPIGDPRLSKMLASLSDVLTYLFAASLSLAVMFVITVGLIMATGSVAFAGG